MNGMRSTTDLGLLLDDVIIFVVIIHRPSSVHLGFRVYGLEFRV